jgi:hypothetical protein
MITISRKETLVVGNHECRIENKNNEPYLVISYKGISEHNFSSSKTTWAKQKVYEIYLPLYYLPYIMKSQREKIAEWETKEKDFIDRIKKAYNTEVQPVK